MRTLDIVRYDKSLSRLAENFHSSNTYLDWFLLSPDALDPNYGTTYVLLSETINEILGYYNIGVGCIEVADEGLRWRLGGSVHINCFALDTRYHGVAWDSDPVGERVNISDYLLYDLVNRARAVRDEIGFAFITLNSTKDGYPFYSRNDFEPLDADMYCSMDKTDIECTSMYYAFEWEN